MDKVFSTRLDEELVKRIDLILKEKPLTKKALVEQALRAYLKESESNMEFEIIDRSFGIWERKETPSDTWLSGRRSLNEGFRRLALDKDKK